MNARGDQPRRRGLGSWHRPVWRNPAWWFAVVSTALFSLLGAAMLLARTDSWLVWPAIAFQTLVFWIVASAVVRLVVGVVIALERGKQETETKAATRATGRTRAEEVAGSAGRLAGRWMGQRQQRSGS